MIRLRSFYNENAYSTQFQAFDSVVGKIASILFVSNIFFMTRAYALSNLVETVLFGLFLFTPSLRQEFIRTLRDPLLVPLAGYFCWALLSGLWGGGTILEILHDWWGWRKLLLLPIGLVLLQDRRVLKASVWVALLVGLFFFGLASTAWILDLGNIWQRPYTSVLQNHNAQGIYFSIFSIAIVLSAFEAKCHISIRLAMILTGIGLILFTIFLGSSRSGYVAALIASTCCLLFLFRRRKSMLVLAALFPVVALLSSPYANDRIHQAVSEMLLGAADQGGESKTSGGIRVVMWKNTLNIIGDHWLIGTGAGGFDKAYAEEVQGQSGWRAVASDNPHSHYLHVWAEYGLVGLLLFLWFLLGVGVRSDLGSPWGWILLATLLIAFCLGVFDGVFGSAINGRIILLSFVISLACIGHERADHLKTY